MKANMNTRGQFDQLLFEATINRNTNRYRPRDAGLVDALYANVAFTLPNGTPVSEGDALIWSKGKWSVMSGDDFDAKYELVDGDDG